MLNLKGIPSSDIVWVTRYDSKGDPVYVLTSKAARDTYFLYRVENGKYVKVGQGKSPPELLAKQRFA